MVFTIFWFQKSMDFDETMAVTEYDWKSSVIQNGGALEIFWKAKLGATACQCLILQIFSFNSKKKKTKQNSNSFKSVCYNNGGFLA